MTNSSRRTTRESADGRDHTNGWIYARLDDYWAVIDCKHVTAEFLDVGYPVVSIGEVQGRYVDVQNAPKTTRDFYMLLTQNPRKPVVGDLIMSRNASVGLVAQVADQNPLFAMGQDVCLLRRRKRSYSPDFMQFLLSSPAMEKQLTRMMAGSTFKRLNVRQIKDLTIPFPPAAVQASIGLALSDAEDLIATLNRVITKRKAIRQGMMQELLSGGTRLPGYTEPWPEVLLGDLAQIVTGGTPKSSMPGYWDGGIAWCTPTDITKEKGRYLRVTARTISKEGLENSSAQLLPRGSILLCTRATIGELKLASGPIATNQGFKSLVPNVGVSAEFLYYRVLMMKEELASFGTGSTFLEVSKRDVSGLRLIAPNANEQNAIATVLTEVDDELDAMHARLNKAKAVKEGMMQALLTGRTRLPVEEGAA